MLCEKKKRKKKTPNSQNVANLPLNVLLPIIYPFFSIFTSIMSSGSHSFSPIYAMTSSRASLLPHLYFCPPFILMPEIPFQNTEQQLSLLACKTFFPLLVLLSRTFKEQCNLVLKQPFPLICYSNTWQNLHFSHTDLPDVHQKEY